MPSPTTIRTLTAAPLDIPLHAPFGIAGGAQEIARNVLVTVELADGTRGYGEAAPFPAFNGETQAMALAAVEAALAVVEGADVREWRRIATSLRSLIGSARCAIETAVLDALTQHAALPLWAFFGGAEARLETDMTVTTGTTDEAAAAGRGIMARGITTIKVKIGSGDVALDLERVLAIHAAAPAARLILDGNCGLTPAEMLDMLTQLSERRIGVALLEQPVAKDDLRGMRRVAEQSGVPVAADESAANAADVLRLVREHAANVINIKLMKGGIVEALEIAAVARAAGMGLMIGGMVESRLAMSVSACFAAGLGGFGFVDLDTPLFLAEDPFVGGMRYSGGTILLDEIIVGHGVTPKTR
jgi:L-alanine-DL-glutamate epimerase-like enolase superfamily enzyme